MLKLNKVIQHVEYSADNTHRGGWWKKFIQRVLSFF